MAEHASEESGGEAVLPIRDFSQLRQRGVEAWLVVHERSLAELTRLLPKEGARSFTVSDLWFHRESWFASGRLPDRVAAKTPDLSMHLLTGWLHRRLVRRRVRELHVNIVHEPIPVSLQMQSMMHGVGAPVAIGPMNGGMTYPLCFYGRPARSVPWRA